MKQFLLTLVSALIFTSMASAKETRTFKKIDSTSAEISIAPNDPNTVSAQEFLDGKENQEFLDMLLKDPKSKLAKIKATIEKDAENGGNITYSDSVVTGSGHSGGMEAYAERSLFVGFVNEGSGSEYYALYLFSFSESVSLNLGSNGDVLGLTKTLKVTRAQKLQR